VCLDVFGGWSVWKPDIFHKSAKCLSVTSLHKKGTDETDWSISRGFSAAPHFPD
jgi:hypothetical protein